MDTRKRNRTDLNFNANGGFKKSKSELDPISGIGSKSKACTKFFSVAGCPFGESCHFLHYVPGGYNAVAQMMNLPPVPGQLGGVGRNVSAPPPHQNGSPAAAKTKLCNKYSTAEGCKFGDKCHFAHGELELGKAIAPSPPHPMGGRFGFGGRMEPHPPALPPVSSFGSSATTKISVNASLAGAIIGKSGVNSKQICRETGVKLSIRDHETDPNLKNIELEGTLEQIHMASSMVRQLITNLESMGIVGGPGRGPGFGGAPAPQANNFKTKLCENFTKGSCTFGDRCHFAHGAAELRKSGV